MTSIIDMGERYVAPALDTPDANPFRDFSPAVEVAWGESFLADLSASPTSALLDGAREVSLDAGEIFYRGAHHADTVTLALVLDGLLRVVVGDHVGREMTLRYAAEGAVVGLPAVLLGGAPTRGEQSETQWIQMGGDSLSGEAIQQSTILKLQPARFRRMASEDAEVAWATARYLARETIATQQLLVAGVFLPVRSRVARHLLDLARRDDGRFVVDASHQEIANAIGTVREVVSRVLRRLATDGLVARDGAHLILVDSAALHEISTGHTSVSGSGSAQP